MNGKSPLAKWIRKMFDHSFKKEWYETYWAFDIHGTILKPNFRKNSKDAEFYPYAKETLQLLTKRKDVVMIIWTSSYPEEIKYYQKIFELNNIKFEFINENPMIASNLGNFGYYEKKFYFNVCFEDKSGFDPDTEWEEIYKLLIRYENEQYLPDPKWTTKF